MGLDITAYRNLTKATDKDDAFDSEGELRWDEGWERFYVNPDFPGRAGDIDDGAAYRAEDSFGFRAGSYSGYSLWREHLAALAGYRASVVAGDDYSERFPHSRGVHVDPKPGPFVELINFSDCEGVIGAAVSAKLARDFAEYQAKADQHPDEWFRDRYAMWRKAFEMAADNGAVAFH